MQSNRSIIQPFRVATRYHARTMQPSSPQDASSHNMRPALRVGLIGGLTLGLAVAAQQVAGSVEMRMLGNFIVMAGFALTGWFAARETRAQVRQQGTGAGALSGLIAGLFVSAAFIALSMILSLDPDYMRTLQMQIKAQLSADQMSQLQSSGVDMRSFTQFSYGFGIFCCGLSFPVLGLLLGAVGGGSAAMVNRP